MIDDIAIAEAIAQIEKELKGKQPEPLPPNLKGNDQETQTLPEAKEEGPFSFAALFFIILVGAVTAKLAFKLF